MKTLLKGCLIALIGLPYTLSAEGLSVSPLVMNFVAGKTQFQDLVINNSSDRPVYVRAETVKLLHPEQENSKTEPYNLADPYHFGIAVSKQRLSMQPYTIQVLRVVSLLNSIKQDQVYRVSMRPFIKPEPLEARAKSAAARVNVLVGYKVLIIVRPQNGQAKIVMARHGKQITLTNQGNTNALMYMGRQCDQHDHCQKLPSKRLYAGQKWSFDLPYDAPVTYAKKVANHVSLVRSK